MWAERRAHLELAARAVSERSEVCSAATRPRSDAVLQRLAFVLSLDSYIPL